MKHALHGRGLSRQIVLSMSAVVVSVTLLVLVGSYFFYSFLFVFHPKFFEDDSWIPTGPEWAWLIFIMLVGVAIAVYVAVRLARRILAPLTSVTSGLRQVAQGDLTVRAELRNAGWGEASLLVNDFNSMAERIQSITAERAIWNASIAHELRTPVTILRGRLQGLAEGVFTPDEAQFNVFQRGEASRSRAMGSSGLGLSVVRAIAEVHGGHASYRKGEKGGALFEIALPR